jgi:hypothetical protein
MEEWPRKIALASPRQTPLRRGRRLQLTDPLDVGPKGAAFRLIWQTTHHQGIGVGQALGPNGQGGAE